MGTGAAGLAAVVVVVVVVVVEGVAVGVGVNSGALVLSVDAALSLLGALDAAPDWAPLGCTGVSLCE